MALGRREFLGSAIAMTAGVTLAQSASKPTSPDASLQRKLGITTGSFMMHLRKDKQLHQTLLLDLPQQMHDDLGMQVIDLMNETLPSLEPKYLDDLRSRAEKYGCILTNLKMNQKDADMASAD